MRIAGTPGLTREQLQAEMEASRRREAARIDAARREREADDGQVHRPDLLDEPRDRFTVDGTPIVNTTFRRQPKSAPPAEPEPPPLPTTTKRSRSSAAPVVRVDPPTTAEKSKEAPVPAGFQYTMWGGGEKPMAFKTTHMRLDVKGALMRTDRELGRLGLVDDEGRDLKDGRKVRSALLDLLGNGVLYLPVGPRCEGWSDREGCPGHEVAAPAASAVEVG
ncbi:hypothetical protein [Longimicrobium sp.]|uniref:hypothetical protein n=1 Tax=Longimicrobium sp. TaxID=2029185 RepID=UPI002F91DAEE